MTGIVSLDSYIDRPVTFPFGFWRQTIGGLGEKIACLYLESQGFKIVETNWTANRCPEIDIVCTSRDGCELVFCEVKTRMTRRQGLYEEFDCGIQSVNFKKQKQIIKGSRAYLSNNTSAYPSYSSVRFDLIVLSIRSVSSFFDEKRIRLLTVDPASVDLLHIERAFLPPCL